MDGIMKNLKYHLMIASDCNEGRHPQIVMKELGITYKEAYPQPLGDQWWFVDCDNIPSILPEYILEIDFEI